MKLETWRFRERRVGFAVGDIHGRADLLEKMLDVLETTAKADQLIDPIVVFLGDYVDRGPHSYDVIELLISGRPWGFEHRFLMGNHEQALLAFIDNPRQNRRWLSHGGMDTLASYGVAPPSVDATPDELDRAATGLADAMPPAHRTFLRRLERFAAQGDYLFVHAGVDPGKMLHEQTDGDLYWVREKFLSGKRQYSHCIVHGHTPERAPFRDARRIGLDTGAYFSGVLSAVRLDGAKADFLSVEVARSD